MSGTPVTQKANLQIIGNYILSQAGSANFVQAAQATLAQSVTNAAQPNITSVGTLSSLTVTGNVSAGNISTTGNISGNTNGFAIGYRDIPQISFTGNATIAATDGGKHYYSTLSTANTLTISNSATTNFAIGTAINIINQGTANILVNAASGVTLYLAGNSTAGNRVVSSFGMATIQKVATDTWWIVGPGVS